MPVSNGSMVMGRSHWDGPYGPGMGDRTGVSITTSLLIGGYFLQLLIPTKNVSSDLKALYKSVIIIIIPCSEKSTYYIVCVCVRL